MFFLSKWRNAIVFLPFRYINLSDHVHHLYLNFSCDFVPETYIPNVRSLSRHSFDSTETAIEKVQNFIRLFILSDREYDSSEWPSFFLGFLIACRPFMPHTGSIVTQYTFLTLTRDQFECFTSLFKLRLCSFFFANSKESKKLNFISFLCFGFGTICHRRMDKTGIRFFKLVF